MMFGLIMDEGTKMFKDNEFNDWTMIKVSLFSGIGVGVT